MIRCTWSPHLQIVAPATWGRQHRGFAPGGPQDRWSAGWVNRICDNPVEAPLIEATLTGAQFTATTTVDCCLGGAPGPATIGHEPIASWQRFRLLAGQSLTVQAPRLGLRWYLGVVGVGAATEQGLNHASAGAWQAVQRPISNDLKTWLPLRGVLRVLPGPEFERISDRDAILGPWRISGDSSAMGLRLIGPTLSEGGFDIPSSGVADGTIQGTAAGPILLLRQRQTLGGYARMLQVIESDVDVAAQIRPGHSLRLHLINEEQASTLAEQRQRAERLVLHRESAS
jgi:5-oxoprolinase (ATP-hydrolysing) subunit C